MSLSRLAACLGGLRLAVLPIVAATLSGCGGGGDGNGSPQPAPQPTLTISANPASVTAGQSSTLTWSSTNATGCTASQGWSGPKVTSGSEQAGPLTLTTTFTLTCTGGGGSAAQSATVTVAPASGDVVVSGRVTFERPIFRAAAGGLDIDNPQIEPARQVLVEAIDPGTRARIGSAVTTDVNGNYSLAVPRNTDVLISARAEMVKTGAAPTWNFRVLNNTNGGALFVLDGTAFNSGTASSTRDLLARTGWNGMSYGPNRAAAPFAILDTLFQAKELLLEASPSTSFPALDLNWSPANKATVGKLCTTTGDIGTTFFASGGPNADNCVANGALNAGIYILGDFAGGNGDTDEFDQHVIAHEFGHYVENSFSRSDSLGGGHGAGDRLDLRVAFGEGWGNAYAAMVLADPDYRDSFRGVTQDSGFNLEADSTLAEGWFSESSVGEILWDLFDNVADAGDQVALGFAPIFTVMTGAQRNTDAVTSLFSFVAALRSANPTQAGAINALLAGEQISNSDAFGNNEGNTGGSLTAIPIYQNIVIGQPLSVCGSGADDEHNKLGHRRLLRLALAAPAVLTITATGAVGGSGSVAATDPDIFVYRRGAVVQSGQATGQTETISQQPFDAGLHIIEVFDFDFTTGNANVPHCMTVSVTG